MVKIIQGEDKLVTVRLLQEPGSADIICGEPVDLSAVTEISVCFDQTNGSKLFKTLTGGGITIVNADAGKFTITLTDVETALLKEVIMATLEVTLDEASDRTIIQIPNAFEVVAKIC